jgi:transposase
MRRSFDSLAEIVRESMGQEPRSGCLFVFRNKLEDCMKVLYWDGDGYAIWYKRLDKGQFKLPSASAGTLEISAAEFSMLLSGFDLAQIKRRERQSHVRTSV